MKHHIPEDLVARIGEERERLLAVSAGTPETDAVVSAWCSLVSEVIVHLEGEYSSGEDIHRRSFRDWIDNWSDLYVSADELETIKPMAETIPLEL